MAFGGRRKCGSRTEVPSREETGEGARLSTAVRSERSACADTAHRRCAAEGGVRIPFLARSAPRHAVRKAQRPGSGPAWPRPGRA